MGPSGRGVVGIVGFFAFAASHFACMERDVGRSRLLGGLERVKVRKRRWMTVSEVRRWGRVLLLREVGRRLMVLLLLRVLLLLLAHLTVNVDAERHAYLYSGRRLARRGRIGG